jgi:hypothetical protein
MQIVWAVAFESRNSECGAAVTFRETPFTTLAIFSIVDQWSIVPKDRSGMRQYACKGAYDVEL